MRNRTIPGTVLLRILYKVRTQKLKFAPALKLRPISPA